MIGLCKIKENEGVGDDITEEEQVIGGANVSFDIGVISFDGAVINGVAERDIISVI